MPNNQNHGGQNKNQGEQRQQQQGGGMDRDAEQRRDQQHKQAPPQGNRKPNEIDDEDSDRAGQR